MDVKEERQCHWETLPITLNSHTVFDALFQKEPDCFWLDNQAQTNNETQAWSYMGSCSPTINKKITFYACENELHIHDQKKEQIMTNTHLFDALKDFGMPTIKNPPPCPFQGGYIGWIGYEAGQDVPQTLNSSDTIDSLLIDVNRYIATNHLTQTCLLIQFGELKDEPWFDLMKKKLRTQTHISPDPSFSPKTTLTDDSWGQPLSQYLDDIKQCQEWIKQGETYQVCLTNELNAEFNGNPFDLYTKLRTENPTAYGAFFQTKNNTICSVSPEQFLQVNESGHVQTKPIKGTRARHQDSIKDAQLKAALMTSEKDHAENNMIVDLLRNDLAKVCNIGSIQVPTHHDIESYTNVHQLVSTVTGQLSKNQTIFDCIAATFPGGSITGAPKIRTMQLIQTLEKRKRGIYTGSIGWIGFNGSCNLSIAIRTIFIQNNKLSLGSGGGIVYQSNPEIEIEEIKTKAMFAGTVLNFPNENCVLATNLR